MVEVAAPPRVFAWWPIPWINQQRGVLFLWAPVLLAIGIGTYFGLGTEPERAVLAGLAALVLALWLGGLLIPAELRFASTALALLVLGTLIAGARAHWVAEPVLGFRYYGPIEGRIVKIDRSHSDKVRLTLDQVRLDRVAPARTPHKVRVSLHGAVHFAPEPGLRVMMTGHLSPPQGPVEPGGFDFRRMAWFAQLGAVGYTRTPALLAAAPETAVGQGLRVHRLRARISTYVQEALPGRDGAFAAAVTTGDRAGMDQGTIEALRASNLAHLLAISGLHMGLLTGFVFGALRLLLALAPPVALRWPTKKIAACVALAAGAFYYLMSGGNVATERAFIMVSVMLAAILFDRRAITLRAVAIAALIVLGLRPETLLSPGFQMSFAATTALVAVFGAIRDWDRARVPRWLKPVLALVISSAVAGLATAPVAAAHFNRVADYGLIANLLSVPMMGLVVVPGAVLAAVLAPLGLAWVGLALMRLGIAWILWVADWVAGLPGATSPIIAPQPYVLPMIALGALWLFLWRGRARLAGVVPVLAALALWSQATRPPLLISESGALMGRMTAEGRALSKPRGDGFTAEGWLENDGDFSTQEAGAARPEIERSKSRYVTAVGGHAVVLLTGKRGAALLDEACAGAALVVLSTELERAAPCAVLDRAALRRSGALAVHAGEGGLKVVSANAVSGARLWSAPAARNAK